MFLPNTVLISVSYLIMNISPSQPYHYHSVEGLNKFVLFAFVTDEYAYKYKLSVVPYVFNLIFYPLPHSNTTLTLYDTVFVVVGDSCVWEVGTCIKQGAVFQIFFL